MFFDQFRDLPPQPVPTTNNAPAAGVTRTLSTFAPVIVSTAPVFVAVALFEIVIGVELMSQFACSALEFRRR